MAQITKNFKASEFRCSNGMNVPRHLEVNMNRLAENLQVLRDELGCSISINSSYRTDIYNKIVGGVRNSQHLLAKAADIVSKNHTPTEVSETIERLIKSGLMDEGGLGTYNSFTHYDIRGHKSRWDKRS